MSSTAVALWKPDPSPVVVSTMGGTPIRVLPLPWKDPSTVSKEDLVQYIAALEVACQENPRSADLKTCLGIAYAMDLEPYKSMDTLEAAVKVEPRHFFAQYKLSELYYRLRALPRAEEETLKAVELAGNPWELSLAKKQLIDIRRLTREGTQKPEWSKSLRVPVLVFLGMCLGLFLVSILNK